jgi:peroxiredoxin
VQIVTVCADTPEEIREGRGEHGLKARMLSDRDLVVTDAFGLRNQGIHSGPPFGAEALPVPTSLLIDGDGTVLWMDQSEDYQRRSDPDYVLAALREHLD